MLKFHLRKERLNFTADWATPDKQMVGDDPDADLLAKLLGADYQDHLDQIIQSIDNDE